MSMSLRMLLLVASSLSAWIDGRLVVSSIQGTMLKFFFNSK
jgi:hypothetical protein